MNRPIPRVSLKITPHGIPPRTSGGARQALDLSPYIVSAQASKSLLGDSVGQWSATLVFDQADAAAQAAEDTLRRYVRDDDWGVLRFEDGGSGEFLEWDVLVADVRRTRNTDQRGGAVSHTWTVQGQDWARCMTVGQVRISAAFAYANQVTVDSGAGAPDTDDDGNTNTQSQAAAKRESFPNVPGVINLPIWDSIAREATNGAVSPRAHVPLRKILVAMLSRQWRNPEGATLLSRMAWGRFGPVSGVPWQLAQIVNQHVITPDSFLRQFGCLAFNELFYDYAGRRPAVVFRQRPFGPGAWGRLPTYFVDAIATDSVGRSGAERFNFWKPRAAALGIGGFDLLLDTEKGKIPILDVASIARHGIRPAEPSDDYFPPLTDGAAQLHAWYRARLGAFRAWFLPNPEFVTGSVTTSTLALGARVGERVLLPIPWDFVPLQGGQAVATAHILGYAVGTTHVFSVGSDGSAYGETQIDFVRGQPPAGLSVADPIPWV
jgi:hypothetical protein